MYTQVQVYQWQTVTSSRPIRKRFRGIKNIQASTYYSSQYHLYGPIRNFNPIVWVLCISSMFSLDIAKNKEITLSQWIFFAKPNMKNVWASIKLVLYENFGLKGSLDLLTSHFVCILRYKDTNDRQILPPDQEEKDFGGSKIFRHQHIIIANTSFMKF